MSECYRHWGGWVKEVKANKILLNALKQDKANHWDLIGLCKLFTISGFSNQGKNIQFMQEIQKEGQWLLQVYRTKDKLRQRCPGTLFTLFKRHKIDGQNIRNNVKWWSKCLTPEERATRLKKRLHFQFSLVPFCKWFTWLLSD